MDTLRRFLAQLRAYWAGLSLLRRAALVLAVGGILLTLGAVYYLSPTQEYVAVYSDLSLDEVGGMKNLLSAQSIPYELGRDGTSIKVPKERVAEAKVALAGGGFPARGGKGYEIFDDTSLITTPFVQNVNYQRALQAELSRSISQLDPVKSARVLIARSEPTPFVREQRAPTASVVLQLKPNAVMSRSTAAGIASLVARSVEGLKTENVTILDSTGRLLSDPRATDRDNLPTPQLEYRRELETYLSSKAEEMLAQHLGAGRAVIRVSADLNFQQVKERRETYYPEEKTAGAERLTTSKNTGSSSGGVTGAASNVARAGGPVMGGRSGGGSTSSEEVIQTDYLVSKSVRDLEDRMGAVKRLTVAALVDLTSTGEGATVISATDAQEIIKQAIGFQTGRDEVKLTNVRLPGLGGPPEPDEEVVRLQRFTAYVGLARNISLGLAIVLALAIVPLLMVSRRTKPAPVPDQPGSEVVGNAAIAPEDRRKKDINRFVATVQEDPVKAAEVFGLMIGRPA